MPGPMPGPMPPRTPTTTRQELLLQTLARRAGRYPAASRPPRAPPKPAPKPAPRPKLAAPKAVARRAARRAVEAAVRKQRASRAVAGCSRRAEIGRGVAGVVYETCCGARCHYATKVFFSARDFAASTREVRLQMSAAKAGLAPRVISSGCGGGECRVVMERVRETLKDHVRRAGRLTSTQQTAIITLLQKLARLGIDHGDVHSGNIAVDAGFRLRMIDFSEGRKVRGGGGRAGVDGVSGGGASGTHGNGTRGGVNVHAQVGKLVGDLGVVVPRLRFPVLEAFAAKGRPAPTACGEEDTFLRFVKARTGLRVDDPDVQDDLLDIWMDGPSDCEALLRKVKRRFKLA